MRLEDLVNDSMKAKGLRQVHLARYLGVSKQVVSATLRRDLDKCKMGTVREYLEALGMKWKPSALIKQK